MQERDGEDDSDMPSMGKPGSSGGSRMPACEYTATMDQSMVIRSEQADCIVLACLQSLHFLALPNS